MDFDSIERRETAWDSGLTTTEIDDRGIDAQGSQVTAYNTGPISLCGEGGATIVVGVECTTSTVTVVSTGRENNRFGLGAFGEQSCSDPNLNSASEHLRNDTRIDNQAGIASCAVDGRLSDHRLHDSIERNVIIDKRYVVAIEHSC